MLIKQLIGTTHKGYIAGSADGIVKVGGVASDRDITVFDASTLHIVNKTQSLKNGHYMISGLDPQKQYLVMCRDYTRNPSITPAVWDYVTPSTDITIKQQQELWEQWQT